MRRRREFWDLMNRLRAVAWDAMREEYVPNCCIAACAVMRRVLDHYGYVTEPVPVSVEIMNAKMTKYTLENPSFQMPTDPARRKMFLDITGAWGIGIMPESRAVSRANGYDGYGGHLLLHCNGKLIECSLKQADRPEFKMEFPTLFTVDVDRDWLRGGHALELTVNGCTLIYRRIHDHTFRTAPDWTRRTTPFPETVRKIIERAEAVEVEDKLATA